MPRRHLLLELDLTAPLIEPGLDDPLERLLARGRRQLRPTVRALHEAGDDPRVVGVIAKVGAPLPWALAEDLRRAAAAFTASGKPSAAWSESFAGSGGGLAAYALATAFDSIWLQPGGDLGLTGVAAETTFLRGALDKIGIAPELSQRHEYKNAADRIMRTEFSPAHREALGRLAESIYDDAVSAIADGRSMSAEQVRELVDGGPRTAAEARAAGLVDELGYRDQAYAAVRERTGADAVLLFADQWSPRRRLRAPARTRPYVAVVEARGSISSGRSRRTPMGRTMGSDTVAAQLRAALRDDRARALLLHVDSPGGSAVASEVIWREMVRLREAGKTVVVSMGAVAGSGGYYIACPAETVVALPQTLTGSIGVFGGKFVVADLLERAGLRTGAVEQGAMARMFSSRRPFTDAERERLDAGLDAIYDDFVGKVAAGRGRPVAEIEPLARGRVWTGSDALRIGLVDELGGLRDAARIARRQAGLADDAPVRPALHVPPLARLGKPKNSEDPRALTGGGLTGAGLTGGGLTGGGLAGALSAGGWSDLGRALGLPAGQELLMPDVTIR